MRTHPKTLSDAGIGPWRYAELRALCRQYPEARRRLEEARRGIIDKRGGGTAWHKPDPTGNAAIILAAMPEQRVVRAVEECARAVAGSAAERAALIESVSSGRAFDRLRHRPPCGHNQFGRMRLLFYVELDRWLVER